MLIITEGRDIKRFLPKSIYMKVGSSVYLHVSTPLPWFLSHTTMSFLSELKDVLALPVVQYGLEEYDMDVRLSTTTDGYNVMGRPILT